MLDFLGIGSQKAGTTWLFDKLKMHPRVYFPCGKEANFWNLKIHRSPIYRENYHNSLRGPVVDMCRYVCGDITPEYCILPHEGIAAIQHEYPAAQLFLMVRQPIYRAWSSIRMTYKYYNNDLSTLSEEDLIRAITSEKTAELGLYDVMLKRWLSVFPRAQLHLIFMEDLSTHYRPILADVCRAIGVENDFFEQIPGKLLASPSLQGEAQSLDPRVFAACLEFYRDSIGYLEEFTGRDLKEWRVYQA